MKLKRYLNSRRRFLAGSAGALGASFTAANLNAQSSTQTPTDIDLLNFALRLERLEAAFYTQGLAKLKASDFLTANFTTNLTAAQTTSLYANLQSIRDHEVAHVMQITAVINQLGGTPVPQDTYTFSPNSSDPSVLATPDSFIMIARTLEMTGVSAYDGAIGSISDSQLRIAAASIATVEGRHSAYLNELNGQSPFPAANDTPMSMQQVLTTVSAFFTMPVNNAPTPPTISIAARNITTGSNNLMLDISGSTAANGGPLRFIWENYLGGPYVKFSDPSSPTPTITFTGGPGLYTILASVIDQGGTASSIEIKINYTGT